MWRGDKYALKAYLYDIEQCIMLNLSGNSIIVSVIIVQY